MNDHKDTKAPGTGCASCGGATAGGESTGSAQAHCGEASIGTGTRETRGETSDSTGVREREGEASHASGARAKSTEASEPGGQKEPGRLPKPTFSTFVLSLASSALVQLGEVPDPGTGKKEENILAAKHTIDILSMLRDKTRNCLDADEERLLEGLLYELRMKYVVKK